MSDEEVSPAEEKQTEELQEMPDSAPVKTNTKESLRDRFRLTADEEILHEVKPSYFAFISMYFLSVLIFGVHFLFSYEWEATSEDNLFVTLMVWLIDLTTIGEIGFVVVMLAITWFNRMVNGSTSGKWTTVFLLIVSLTPPILRLDDFIAWVMNKDSGFIPLDTYNFMFFGIFWASLFSVITIFYQRSFHYAITNHRVIFTQHLIIPGDGRRILFDNINEIRTQRTFLGALMGYNTIVCDTGSQLGLGDDSMSVSVGAFGGGGSGEGGSIESQVTKSLFKRMFAFVTYQKSRKVDLPDPRYSFFCITNWKFTENLLNEMHQKHSQSGQITKQSDILNELKNQLVENQD
jgi:hypothetical protein